MAWQYMSVRPPAAARDPGLGRSAPLRRRGTGASAPPWWWCLHGQCGGWVREADKQCGAGAGCCGGYRCFSVSAVVVPAWDVTPPSVHAARLHAMATAQVWQHRRVGAKHQGAQTRRGNIRRLRQPPAASLHPTCRSGTCRVWAACKARQAQITYRFERPASCYGSSARCSIFNLNPLHKLKASTVTVRP